MCIRDRVEDVHFCTGGNATNVAVTFARQGLESAYLWGLGEDPASQSILRELDDEGVDTAPVVQKPEYQSGYSVIMIATNGERTILNHRGKAFGRTGRHDFDLQAIKKYDWLYPTSLGDGGLPLLHEIVSTAAEHNVKVMLNPAGPELADPAKLKTILELSLIHI